MVVQIYSIQTVQEAAACAKAGADRVGVAIDTGANLPAQVSERECAEIFDALDGLAKKVLIVVTNDGDAVLGPLERLRPDVIHICGNEFAATPEFVRKAKAVCPGVEVLQAVGVTGPQAVEEAERFATFCDLLILDSVDPKIAGIGAAGFTHDWSVDAEIVRRVGCPVILAGGLGPENVAEAIRQVRPWGVDSFTKTSDLRADGGSSKNIELVRAFSARAKAAASELGL